MKNGHLTETDSDVLDKSLPKTPDEALDLLDFDREKVLYNLLAAEKEMHDECTNTDFSLRLTSRTVEPTPHNDVKQHEDRAGWYECRCGLMGLPFAVPKLAPVPTLLLLAEDGEDEWMLEDAYMVHPDLLQSPGGLREMVIDEFEMTLSSSIFRAFRALKVLDSLEGLDELPGAFSRVPRYEPLGRRPAYVTG